MYHNLTAHYNAYFNGKEALKEGVVELYKKNKDDYTKILPVFELGTKADAQSVYNYLDRSIEKGSIIITRHSIYIKGIEHVKWIDDAYMLIGKSYYYKQEYDLAAQTFNFVLNRFKDGNTKYEAIIWKARVLTQQGKIDEAEALLVSIEKKIDKNKANRAAEKLYPLAYSDVLIKQQKYDQAIEYLHQALHLNKSRHVRTRLDFILAQTYQRTGKVNKANEYYKKVLGMNPTYDMEFATKINLAKNYDVTMGGGKDIKKLLNRMLRDEKNKEYLDQIHYALAEVYLKENNQELAIIHLKKSARSSISNNYQKSISFLKLGDLYFAIPDYQNAQVFYDSCVMTLPKEFPNYTLIENKKNTLNDLVKNLNIVSTEDSLQMLASLSPNERNKKIQAHINEIVKEEERKRQEEIDRQAGLANIQQINQTGTQSTGSWYFYNPSSMSFGFTEFVRKWGGRKYEDLWRLKNKAISEYNFEEVSEKLDSNEIIKDKTIADLKNVQTYIARLPLTPEAITKSNLKISEALYNIGIIYKESLDDYDRSIDAFNKLEKRFPDSKYILPAFYNLYQIYIENQDAGKAGYYKDKILTKYPDSDFAKMISDPNYYQKLEEQKNLFATFYKATYLAYTSGQYPIVIQNADSAIRSKKDKILIPKFEMLKTLSIGKTRPQSEFVDALNKIVKKYPESEVKNDAQNILDFLNKKKTGGNVTTTPAIDTIVSNTSLYKFDPLAFHFYIVVVEIKNLNINDLKNLFSNHNTKYFSTQKYLINTLFLDDKHEVLNVSRFENKNNAMNYLQSIENAPEILQLLQNSKYKHFVISAANYPVFYKNKDVDLYLKFYNQFYTKP
ncbi:MAG: tetratricopeptide repeat protein [Bacteroidota bacterium]